MRYVLMTASLMNLLQDSLGFVIADLSRSMRKAFQLRLGESPLTLAQARALIYIARNEGIRQVDLAELLEVQPITLVRLIDLLAQAGLIERRADPKDRRAYQLYLKDAAAAHLAEVERVAHSIRIDCMRGLDAPQSAAVLAALRQMRDNLTLSHTDSNNSIRSEHP